MTTATATGVRMVRFREDRRTTDPTWPTSGARPPGGLTAEEREATYPLTGGRILHFPWPYVPTAQGMASRGVSCPTGCPHGPEGHARWHIDEDAVEDVPEDSPPQGEESGPMTPVLYRMTPEYFTTALQPSGLTEAEQAGAYVYDDETMHFPWGFDDGSRGWSCSCDRLPGWHAAWNIDRKYVEVAVTFEVGQVVLRASTVEHVVVVSVEGGIVRAVDAAGQEVTGPANGFTDLTDVHPDDVAALRRGLALRQEHLAEQARSHARATDRERVEFTTWARSLGEAAGEWADSEGHCSTFDSIMEDLGLPVIRNQEEEIEVTRTITGYIEVDVEDEAREVARDVIGDDDADLEVDDEATAIRVQVTITRSSTVTVDGGACGCHDRDDNDFGFDLPYTFTEESRSTECDND